MNLQEQQLWEKIQNYEIDAVDASFPFSARLMRENGWTKAYTLEVIEEYKKFMFLVAVAGHPVSPSDPVDQVWHLHLIYTKSYWDEFCYGILGMPVHHNPTKGGKSERKKHVKMYDQTAESYQKHFGTSQPEHIWVNTKDLFKEIHYKRVNMHRNWVVPKPQFVQKRWHVAPLLALLAMLFMANDGGGVFIFILLFGILIVYLLGMGSGNDKGKRNGGSGGGGLAGCGGIIGDVSDFGDTGGGDSSGGGASCSSCSGCGGCGGCG